MNKRHYEHTLPNIRGSLSNTYHVNMESNMKDKKQQAVPQSEAESFGIKRNPAVRAPRICLSEEEVIRIMRNEDAIKKKIGNLIDSMLCDDSQISEMDNTKNKTEAFDIDEFV